MKSWVKYFQYLLRHKWFVFLECKKRGLFFRGLLHDWSKFLPDEFLAYARFFYGRDSTHESRESRYQSIKWTQRYFQRAWQKHLMRNKHHWQNWINIQDGGTQVILEMPKKYTVEMVCDWIGAGRAQGYYNPKKPMEEVYNWWIDNSREVVLHPHTRRYVEFLLKEASDEKE